MGCWEAKHMGPTCAWRAVRCETVVRAQLVDGCLPLPQGACPAVEGAARPPRARVLPGDLPVLHQNHARHRRALVPAMLSPLNTHVRTYLQYKYLRCRASYGVAEEAR